MTAFLCASYEGTCKVHHTKSEKLGGRLTTVVADHISSYEK